MNTLREVVDQATPQIEQAAHRHILLGGYRPEHLLRFSICGLATELLGEYLKRRHDIDSERQLAILDEVPMEPGVVLRHVTLQEKESGTRIDPTYSQFLSLVGLSRFVIHEHPDLEQYYPDTKVALIEAGDDMNFGWRYAEYASDISSRVGEEYDRQGIIAFAPDGALRRQSRRRYHATYDNLWLSGRYQPMTKTRDHDAQYIIDSCLDGIA